VVSIVQVAFHIPKLTPPTQTGHDFLPLLNGLRKGCSEVRAASLSSDWLTVVFSFSFIPPPTHPPHVIPHISTHTGHDFLPLLNGLRKCCSEIIVLDLPGHGKSGIHVDDPDFQTLVASVVDVIQHTIITTTPPPPTPPTTAAPATSDTKPPRRNEKTALPTSSPSPPKILLVGNSLGGLVAIRVALQIPHHIAALCLLSPAGAPLTEDELTEVKRLFQLQNQAEGLAFVERVCAFPERLPKALRAIMSWACRMRTSSGAIHVIMNKAQPSHMLSKKDLRGLRDTPTLFVWGKHEKVLHAHGLLFFKRYLSSKSTAFCCEEEFGHVPFLDDPKRLLAIMQGFFEGTCSGKGIKGGEVVVGA